MKILKAILIVVVIVVVLALSMDLRVQRLERSPMCDRYRVGSALYIDDSCIKK